VTTLLLTGYSDTFSPLGDVTSERMREYAKKNGYEFHCFRTNGSGIEATWDKVASTIYFLAAFDRVLWIDADQLITNPDITHDYSSGFHASLDWGKDALTRYDFSAGAYLATKECLPLFEELWTMRDECIGRGEWEQTPMRELFKKQPEMLRVHPRRTFNAVSGEVHPDVVDPWQPGDWAVHLTMVPLEQRLELLKKYA